LALPGFHLTEWKTPSVCFDVGRPVPSLTDPPSLTCRQLVARERNWADPQKLLMTGTEINWETYRMIVRENNEQITMSAPPNSPCPCWQELTGDSGWGGVLAETAKTGQPALLLFQPGQNILPLFLESIAMLKPEFRWKTTFSTYYFKELPEHAVCQWKAVPVDSPIAEQLQNKGNHLVINLTRTPQSAPKGTYVEFARFGIDQLLP
jgi:hypothetical protein